jgi:hypothetical protein
MAKDTTKKPNPSPTVTIQGTTKAPAPKGTKKK